MCGRALNGSPVFTMVIPKTGASPTSLNLKISAPACGTFFAYELDCPAGLSSFGSSVAQSTTACAVNTQTYYFAKNATGTNVPFTVDTNTIPNVGNFVFTDANGATYLNDAATIKYYIIGNTTAIGVRNGVVVSSAACTGGGTNNSPFFATAGTSSLNDGKCGSVCDTLLYHNGTGTLPQTGDTIYAGSTTGSSTVTWINYRGFGNFDGANASTTGIVNAQGVIQTIYVCP
jgi:hypothetical protein